MSAQLAIAQPRRIKATHRRRRKIASGRFVQRYYDPAIGRFLSVDPVPTNPNNGANFNSYWYANNNPFGNIDPDGRQSCQVTNGQPCDIPEGPPPPPVCNPACMRMRATSDGGIQAGKSMVMFIVAEKPNGNAPVGHVFLGGVNSNGEIEANGFYPADRLSAGTLVDELGAGAVKDDSPLLLSALNGDPNFQVRRYEVTPAQYATAMQSIRTFAHRNDYAIGSKNCGNAVYSSTYKAGITNGILANYPLLTPVMIYNSMKKNR